MCMFEAHYTDLLSGADIIKVIEFNSQFFPTMKDCCLYAMGRACDMAGPEESFLSLGLISF